MCARGILCGLNRGPAARHVDRAAARGRASSRRLPECGHRPPRAHRRRARPARVRPRRPARLSPSLSATGQRHTRRVFLPFFVHRVLWFHKAGGLEGLGTRAEPAAREPEAATRLSGRFFADPACGRYPKASRQWVPLKIRNACKAWTLSRDSLGLCPAGGVSVMAARANWKGYLRLSLVSCPVALFPATTE